MRRFLLLAVPITLFSATPALADVAIGIEAGANMMAPEVGDNGRFGYGFAGRLGYVIDLSLLNLTPEIKFGYERPALGEGTNFLRPMAGLRLQLGIAVFAIVAFAHVGYGVPVGGPDEVSGGFVTDVGGGVDFTSIPVIDIGIWGAYNRVNRTGPSYQWASIGAHATLTF